jgi:hypothetical protein
MAFCVVKSVSDVLESLLVDVKKLKIFCTAKLNRQPRNCSVADSSGGNGI